MSSWKTVQISDVCEIISGATPGTAVREYWNGEIPWATPADLSHLRGAYIADTPRRLTAAGLRSCGASLLPAESVLFSSRAPIGHVAINTVPMATNQGFKSLIPNRDRLDSKYLFYWLKANRTHLESLGNGATFKEVSKAVVARVTIQLPPIQEQRRIADILDRADALRAKRREALALLDTLTQSIFLDMFGHPLARREGQEYSRLGDVAAFVRGVTFKPADVVNKDTLGVTAVVRTKNVQRELDLSDLLYVTRKLVRKEEQYLRPGDTLVSSANSWNLIGKCCIVPDIRESAAIGGFVTALRADSTTVHPRFLHAWFSSDAIQATARSFGNRTTNISNLNLARCRELPIPVPTLDRQMRFVDAMVKVEKAKFPLEDGAFDELFASLQQRAFSGQL